MRNPHDPSANLPVQAIKKCYFKKGSFYPRISCFTFPGFESLWNITTLYIYLVSYLSFIRCVLRILMPRVQQKPKEC